MLQVAGFFKLVAGFFLILSCRGPVLLPEESDDIYMDGPYSFRPGIIDYSVLS